MTPDPATIEADTLRRHIALLEELLTNADDECRARGEALDAERAAHRATLTLLRDALDGAEQLATVTRERDDARAKVKEWQERMRCAEPCDGEAAIVKLVEMRDRCEKDWQVAVDLVKGERDEARKAFDGMREQYEHAEGSLAAAESHHAGIVDGGFDNSGAGWSANGADPPF